MGTTAAQPAKKPAWVPIKVTYDAEHLDLDKRVLEFKISRAADTAILTVLGEDGTELAKVTSSLAGKAPGTWIPITWTQPDRARVMILRLRVENASDGVAQNVELIPWSVAVDHEDVNFSTDSAKIEAGEAGKLDASLSKIVAIAKKSERFLKLQLYIAGHTDTVGPNAKNRKLSLDRAIAIGKYFRAHGLALPIAIAGYGEEVLKVKTADNTDERANRRADYVLGPAGGAPPFKGPYLKVSAGWKRLP